MSATSGARLPSHGRLAGIDYGTVRIGVAISDPGQMIASPLENYTRQSTVADAEFFKRLVEQEQVVGFVIGLPVHLSGEDSQKSVEAKAFGQWLGEVTGIPVDWIDERFSTAMAEQILAQGNLTSKRRKARLDKLAAQILLTAYLESAAPERSTDAL